jgi:hypothetical protein
MFHYTIGRDPKIDPPCHGKSITYRIATPANCSSWVIGRGALQGFEPTAPEFREAIALARVRQSHSYADQLIRISDNGHRDMVEMAGKDGVLRMMPNHAAIQRDRLTVDTRKWLMVKYNPSVYGDQQRLELTGPGGGPILLALDS